MLNYYIKIAWRNLWKTKGHSLINVLGLAIALACCLLIFQYVTLEKSTDSFHIKADRIFRMKAHVVVPATEGEGIDEDMVHIGPGFAPLFAGQVPGIVNYARIMPDYMQEAPTINYYDVNDIVTFKNNRVFYADPQFLEIFTYPLIAGDPETALTKPGTLLITENAAKKYFGSEDPVNKTLTYNSFWLKGEYIVTGIIKEIPENSHLQFDVLLPIQDLMTAWQNEIGEGLSFFMGAAQISSYFEVTPNTSISAIEQKMIEVLYAIPGNDLQAIGAQVDMQLETLQDIYFDSNTNSTMIRKGSHNTINFFMLIALITLAIALINLINLATARAASRTKEVGIRKVVGAQKIKLVYQLLSESFLIHLVALVLALAIAVLIIPFVNDIAQVNLSPTYWISAGFILLFISVFVIGISISGVFPGLILASFRPLNSINRKSELSNSGLYIRRVLVISQFAGLIILIACIGIILSQLNYMKDYDVGLDMDRIVVITNPSVLPDGMESSVEAETALKNEILKLASVKGVAFSAAPAGFGFTMTAPGTLDNQIFSIQGIGISAMDHNFVDLYGLQLVAGEPFTESTPSFFESAVQGLPAYALINESTVKALKFGSNEEAIGKIIRSNQAYQVRGVLKDFNWSSLHNSISPIIFRHNPSNKFLSVKINSSDIGSTLAAIEAIYCDLFPNDIFQYQFAAEAYNSQYQGDERFASLFGMFAIIAILIGCMGLLGLSSSTAEKRTKEIGIRKVNGAKVSEVMVMLSKDFVKWVGIAFVIAIPIAYFGMDKWLQNFAYKTDMSWWIFALAGLLALGIALLTVSWQSYRAASRNPVEALRYE